MFGSLTPARTQHQNTWLDPKMGMHTINGLCAAKISKFGAAVLVEQDVATLDVAMHDLLAVAVRDGREQLPHVAACGPKETEQCEGKATHAWRDSRTRLSGSRLTLFSKSLTDLPTIAAA
jgi:hypothetical protein